MSHKTLTPLTQLLFPDGDEGDVAHLPVTERDKTMKLREKKLDKLYKELAALEGNAYT